MDIATREAKKHELLSWCKEERVRAAKQLEHFESGLFKVGVSGPEGHIDGSDAMMLHLRQIIENMGQLSAKIRADLGFVDDDQTGE